MEKRDVIPGFRLAMFLVITGVLSGMLVAGVLIALFIKDFNSDYTNRLSLFVGEIFIPLPVIVWALVKKVDTGKLFRFNLRNIRPRHIFYTVVLGAGISILTDEVGLYSSFDSDNSAPDRGDGFQRIPVEGF